jgi:hypothetical protein
MVLPATMELQTVPEVAELQTAKLEMRHQTFASTG